MPLAKGRSVDKNANHAEEYKFLLLRPERSTKSNDREKSGSSQKSTFNRKRNDHFARKNFNSRSRSPISSSRNFSNGYARGSSNRQFFSPKRGDFSGRNSSRLRNFNDSLKPRGGLRPSRGVRGGHRGSHANGRNRGGIYDKVLPARNTSHPHYPVSPVRGDIDTPDEVLDRTELLKRMKEAKDNDNFDVLYRYREMWKELIANGHKSVRPKKRNNSEELSPDNFDLEEIECIDTVEEEENGEEYPDIECTSLTVNKNGDNDVKSKTSSSYVQRSRRNNDEPRSKRKRSENAKDCFDNDGINNGDIQIASNGRRQSDSSENGLSGRTRHRRKSDVEEDDDLLDDDEDEAAYLQFAEDCVDVEAMVKAAAVERLKAVDSTSKSIGDLEDDEDDVLDAEDLDLLTVESAEEHRTAANSSAVTKNARQRKALLKHYKHIIASSSSNCLKEKGNDFKLLQFMPILVKALVSALSNEFRKSIGYNSEVKALELLKIFDLQPKSDMEKKLNDISECDDLLSDVGTSTSLENFDKIVTTSIPCLTELCLTQFIELILKNFFDEKSVIST